MSLLRALEPEVMDTSEEARDYDAMDHEEVNRSFCDDLFAVCPHLGRVLDVGTGTARIPLELCRRAADIQISAIDLAASMLAIARRNVEVAGLDGRIHLARMDAKATAWDAGVFDAVVSNSIVHHIPEPSVVLREMWRLVRPGGVLFVRDLARPESADGVRELVARYAPIPSGGRQSIQRTRERQRALFEASLCAALTVDEVLGIVTVLGIPGESVRRTSDRHWTLAHVRRQEGTRLP